MKIQAWKTHIAWLLCSIQSGQNQLEAALVRWLDVSGAAGREEAFETSMPKTHDHLTTSIRRVERPALNSFYLLDRP